LCTGSAITLEHLPVEKMLAQKRAPRTGSHQRPMFGQKPPPVSMEGPATSGSPSPSMSGEHRALPRGERTSPSQPAAAPGSSSGGPLWDDAPQTSPGTSSSGTGSLKNAVEEVERERILEALRLCAGNQTKAAQMLGISRRTLLNRLDQYGLPRPRK